LTSEERDDLAGIYLDVLRRFDGLFSDGPAPYIASWQQAPVHRLGADVWHLAVEVFTIRRAPGKLKHLAGSESGPQCGSTTSPRKWPPPGCAANPTDAVSAPLLAARHHIRAWAAKTGRDDAAARRSPA